MFLMTDAVCWQVSSGATDSQVLSRTLSITADSDVAVSDNYTLTLIPERCDQSLGANTLTLSGGGSTCEWRTYS